jgi:hypothetical protein
MRNGTRQLNMAHAFATDFRQCHFNATFLADDTTMLETLVLTTQALIVFGWPKDFGAEQAITFRLEGPIVYRFGLFYFTVRP